MAAHPQLVPQTSPDAAAADATSPGTAVSVRPRSLVRKLAEVMALVHHVPKRGRNDFHKYDYATEADIANTVRQALAARHVMLVPSVLGETRHPVGEKGSVLTVLEMEMEFLDGETGETLLKPWRGYGSDKEDKGGYKAMTGAEKYFLLKTFLMPTGDDPEAEDPRHARRGRPRQAAEASSLANEEDNAPITRMAAKRLGEAMAAHNVDVAAFKTEVARRYGYDTSAAIRVRDYAAIVRAAQAGGQFDDDDDDGVGA